MEHNLSNFFLGRNLQNHGPELHHLYSGQLYQSNADLIQLQKSSQGVHSFCVYVFLLMWFLRTSDFIPHCKSDQVSWNSAEMLRCRPASCEQTFWILLPNWTLQRFGRGAHHAEYMCYLLCYFSLPEPSLLFLCSSVSCNSSDKHKV